MQITDTSLVHFFGLATGIFLATALYMLFFAASSLFERGQRYITITFSLLSVGCLLFTLYSIFCQISYSALDMSYHPWFVLLAKLAAPLALILSTEIFLRNLSIQSFDAYQLVKQSQRVRFSLLLINVICFVALIFIHNLRDAITLIQLMFIPSTVAALMMNWKGTQNSIKRHVISSILLFSLSVELIFVWFLKTSQGNISSNTILFMSCTYALVMLFLSFAVIRYGFDEAKRFNEIKRVDKKRLANDLYAAIEHQEFFLEFQPKLNLKTNQPSGLEALIRWQHPSKGVISPQDFIALAEQTQLINRICCWVIEETIKHSLTLQHKGWHLPISINFSALNMNPDVIDHLAACIEKYEISPKLIMVEVTESLLIEHGVKELTALHMLHTLGIQLSLDDYGTGFSSLNYIRSLEVKELKIDQSFITNLDTSEESLIIVKSTLQMSHGLKLNVVAEGVESDLIKHILTDLGCDIVQGYAISKPLAINELISWLSLHMTTEK